MIIKCCVSMRSVISISVIISSLVIFSLAMDRIAQGFNAYPLKKVSTPHRDFKAMKGFMVTAYCPGKCCNGRWAGKTASGRSMDYYSKKGIRIIAVDPDIIPLGSIIIYNDLEYFACDTGGKIIGRRLDVLVPTHDDTFQFGVKKDQSILVSLPFEPRQY